jgi:hypothetical protein
MDGGDFFWPKLLTEGSKSIYHQVCQCGWLGWQTFVHALNSNGRQWFLKTHAASKRANMTNKGIWFKPFNIPKQLKCKGLEVVVQHVVWRMAPTGRTSHRCCIHSYGMKDDHQDDRHKEKTCNIVSSSAFTAFPVNHHTFLSIRKFETMLQIHAKTTQHMQHTTSVSLPWYPPDIVTTTTVQYCKHNY